MTVRTWYYLKVNVKKHFLIRSVLVFHIGNNVFILFTRNILLCGFKIKTIVYLFVYLFSRLTLTCSSSFSFSFWTCAALSSASAQASCSCDTQISNVHFARVAGAARKGNKRGGDGNTSASRKFLPSKTAPATHAVRICLTQVTINFLLSLSSENLKATAG